MPFKYQPPTTLPLRKGLTDGESSAEPVDWSEYRKMAIRTGKIEAALLTIMSSHQSRVGGICPCETCVTLRPLFNIGAKDRKK